MEIIWSDDTIDTALCAFGEEFSRWDFGHDGEKYTITRADDEGERITQRKETTAAFAQYWCGEMANKAAMRAALIAAAADLA